MTTYIIDCDTPGWEGVIVHRDIVQVQTLNIKLLKYMKSRIKTHNPELTPRELLNMAFVQGDVKVLWVTD